VTFSAFQVTGLMAFVEEHYPTAVPFFALCMFAGIRPCLRTGEILRLQPAHFKLEANLIRIDGEVSKVREPRNVAIQPNLAAWLHAYPLKKFPIIPSNLQHIREKVAQKFPLSHDIMRHTFISMFVAKFRSIGEAALQAGTGLLGFVEFGQRGDRAGADTHATLCVCRRGPDLGGRTW